MKRKPRNGNNAQPAHVLMQSASRQPRSSTGTGGSMHGRAQVAFDPVRDRIDSGWAPGVPDDLGLLQNTLYQVTAGRVYTLVTWPDESTIHSEVPMQQLMDLLDGKPAIEGWYTVSGVYLGEQTIKSKTMRRKIRA